MRWYGKEITVARGETFSLTCKITNEDGTPYMISSALQNPTFLLTIANTLYQSDDKRYVLKCWTPLVVKSPNIVTVDTLSGATDTSVVYYLTEDYTVNDVTYDGGNYYQYNGSSWNLYDIYVNGYIFDDFNIIEVSSLPNPGVHYKLYKLTTDNKYYIYIGTSWREYETVFMQNFPSIITKEWYSKNFYYELRLVAGEYTQDFIDAIDDNTYSQFDDNPFDLITEEFVIIPKTQMNVLSRLGGYDNA